MRSVILALVLVILAAAYGGYATAGQMESHMTREQIEQEIAKALPRGTSRQKVIAFLKAHDVENSSSSANAPRDRILAIYRDVTGSTSTVTKSVQVVFVFKNNALESFSATEQFTGP